MAKQSGIRVCKNLKCILQIPSHCLEVPRMSDKNLKMTVFRFIFPTEFNPDEILVVMYHAYVNRILP